MFQLASAFWIAAGVYAYIEKEDHRSDDSDFDFDMSKYILDISVIMIVVGCVVFVISFPGFIGALRENILLLNIVSLMKKIL